MRPRYYTRTVRYHVWAIMERHEDNRNELSRPNSDLDTVLEFVGARGRGDAGAREYCRSECARLERMSDI